MYYISMVSRPHDEHRSFGPRRENFVRTSNFFGFLKELYKNKFKNLIRTSKFKLSFRGLDQYLCTCIFPSPMHRFVLGLSISRHPGPMYVDVTAPLISPLYHTLFYSHVFTNFIITLLSTTFSQDHRIAVLFFGTASFMKVWYIYAGPLYNWEVRQHRHWVIMFTY